jgi:DNA-binding CsgD family transcriptional regulator
MIKPIPLTPHQIVVLKKIATDKSIKQIAGELNVSPKTIEFHWMRLRKKLGVNTYVGATHYALANNIVKFLDFQT